MQNFTSHKTAAAVAASILWQPKSTLGSPLLFPHDFSKSLLINVFRKIFYEVLTFKNISFQAAYTLRPRMLTTHKKLYLSAPACGLEEIKNNWDSMKAKVEAISRVFWFDISHLFVTMAACSPTRPQRWEWKEESFIDNVLVGNQVSSFFNRSFCAFSYNHLDTKWQFGHAACDGSKPMELANICWNVHRTMAAHFCLLQDGMCTGFSSNYKVFKDFAICNLQ